MIVNFKTEEERLTILQKIRKTAAKWAKTHFVVWKKDAGKWKELEEDFELYDLEEELEKRSKNNGRRR